MKENTVSIWRGDSGISITDTQYLPATLTQYPFVANSPSVHAHSLSAWASSAASAEGFPDFPTGMKYAPLSAHDTSFAAAA